MSPKALTLQLVAMQSRDPTEAGAGETRRPSATLSPADGSSLDGAPPLPNHAN